MPKRLQKRLPTDVNQLAHELVRRSTEGTDEPAPDFKSQLSAYMSKLGKKGGQISGAKRMEMPAKKRRDIAMKAAKARWAKTSKP